MTEFIKKLRFNEDGLIPAIAQQWDSGEVLMMAWMSKKTLLKSLKQKKSNLLFPFKAIGVAQR